jgi:DNA-binding CsgD family transcriptional regulator/energy-coupling factor transporter ATP-binding protein EcfA2
MTILERESQLDTLHQLIHHAAEGTGQVIFIAAESGGGKSTLIEHFAQSTSEYTRTVVVRCDGLKMPGPFGTLADFAGAFGPDVEAALTQLDSRDSVFRAILSTLRNTRTTTILVIEDAHWSDQASLELIRFLGRRISTIPALFVITYREDSLDPYHPLRSVLGDLVTEPACTRMTLPPLSLEAVSALTEGTGIDPAVLHERTNGNPFYITESIASGARIPDSIRDAVLGRASSVSPEARAILDCAATLGVTFDPDLLEDVIGAPIIEALDECLAAGMFRPLDDGISFRHGLTRDVFLKSMSLPRRRDLHRRILRILETNPAFTPDLAHLAHHAEEANDPAAVLRYAPAAARHAVALGAHREAAAQFARALRFGHGLPIDTQAELLEERSYECYLIGDLATAIETCEQATELRRTQEHLLKVGDNLRWLSRYCWFAGRNEQAERHGEESTRLLETLPPGPELAMAYSNLAQLRVLSYQLDEAVSLGNRAIALATELNNPAITAHALANVGTALWVRSEPEGRRMLERSIEIGIDHALDDDVARSYANLAWVSVDHYALDTAAHFIEAGIAFTAERDLTAMNLYLRATRARTHLARGRWQLAAEEATAIVDHPNSTALARIPALTVLGRIAARRGEESSAFFDEAETLAAPTGQLMRQGPLAVARAEAAWLSGQDISAIDTVLSNYDRASQSGDRWLAGELALWLYRGGIDIADSSSLAEPFALEITGHGAEAAAIWNQLGCPLEAARALATTAEETALRQALSIAERLGARPDSARAAQALRNLGVTAIPRGPRPQTQANPAQLTERELEVLSLLVHGQTNREIAAALYLSPRTVGHHVSAILGKLEISSRADAPARVAELQLFPI